MKLKTETKKLQEELAAYTRDGVFNAMIGAKNDRLAHYRRLVYNVTSGILDQAYPITKSSIETTDWNTLKLHFHKKHNCQYAEVWKMPEDLIFYVADHEPEILSKYPYLIDLLKFEWLEIEIQNQMNDTDFESDWNSGEKNLINPYHQLTILEYPVHKMKASEAENKIGKYYLLTYRKLSDFQVMYMELTAFTAVFFESMKQQTPNYEAAFIDTCNLFNMEPNQILTAEKEYFIASLKNKEILT